MGVGDEPHGLRRVDRFRMRNYRRRNPLLFYFNFFMGVLKMTAKDMDRLLDEAFAKVFGSNW